MPTAAADIARAAELLRGGRLVVFPTETVYGLGANALDADAVAKIYAVKGRPATSPLIVHVASIEMAKPLAAEWPATADLLTKKFWPGPLTVVVKKQPAIPFIVTAGLNTVGLRMPAHPVALALIRAVGIPLAAPSANRFTEISPTTAEHVRHSLGSDVDLILDGGPCEIGIESTVISLAGARPVLLRPGGISRAQLEEVVGPIASAQEASERDGETDVPAPLAGTSSTVASEGVAHPSPGMHVRHYSPRTPLFLIRDGKTRDGKLSEKGKGIYLQRTRPPNLPTQANSGLEWGTKSGIGRMVQIIQMPHSAADYAAVLYDKLHQADDAGADWIAVDLPPATPEWEAIHDRLRRAASNENKS
jgi:L-threonylcarbamoyladenylate synthase